VHQTQTLHNQNAKSHSAIGYGTCKYLRSIKREQSIETAEAYNPFCAPAAAKKTAIDFADESSIERYTEETKFAVTPSEIASRSAPSCLSYAAPMKHAVALTSLRVVAGAAG
jgi:hypothetical protein